MFWFRGAAVSLMFVTILANAIAFPEAAHSLDKGQGKPSKLWQELNLSPQQKQRINDLHQKSTAKMRGYQKSLAKAKKDLAELKSSQASASRITQKQNEIASIQLQISELRKEYTAAMKDILTTEQWTKLQKLKKERQENRNEV
jgi:Spy/CpxP family protein refolding chaperone